MTAVVAHGVPVAVVVGAADHRPVEVVAAVAHGVPVALVVGAVDHGPVEAVADVTAVEPVRSTLFLPVEADPGCVLSL